MHKIQRITIIRTTPPITTDINEELQWIGGSLGLFNLRDKDKSCFRIFIELIKNTRNDQVVSSDELAFKLSLARGTVVHHLNKLLDAGIIVVNRNKYELPVNSLSELVDLIEADFEKSIQEMRAVAKGVDAKLGLD
ncbi:MAG: putative transcriptional regulator [Candidatus Woesearchaeota archaeon]|jgi:predicted transcriptional regulator